MKKKNYNLYDNYTTYFVLIGLSFGYLIAIVLNVWAIKTVGFSDAVPLMLVLDIPATVSIALAYKPQVFSRLLTRCTFDEQGIHCKSPRWGKFDILWDEVRTYGVYGYSFSYASMTFLYFTSDAGEYAPRKSGDAAVIRRDRIVFQNRDSLWPALTEYMPKDMIKRLDDAIRHTCNGHFKRNPTLF